MKTKTKSITVILLLVVAFLLVGCTRNQLSSSLMHKAAVTKAFKQANLGSNVLFYDAKTTPDIALTTFDTSEYNQIDLLMYSDGCKTCNHMKSQLVKDVKGLVRKHDLVILINSDDKLEPMRKHFPIPRDYKYPTLFSFSKDHNGKMVLTSQTNLRTTQID